MTIFKNAVLNYYVHYMQLCSLLQEGECSYLAQQFSAQDALKETNIAQCETAHAPGSSKQLLVQPSSQLQAALLFKGINQNH